jgi:hypothetical protein
MEEKDYEHIQNPQKLKLSKNTGANTFNTNFIQAGGQYHGDNHYYKTPL